VPVEAAEAGGGIRGTGNTALLKSGIEGVQVGGGKGGEGFSSGAEEIFDADDERDRLDSERRRQAVRELQPVLTGPLFAEVRRELVSLLSGLTEEEWQLPTAAPQWNAKDVALHILGGDVGNLSRRRDGHSLTADLSSYEKLVAFINEINASWVLAGQRMSTAVMIDLTEHVGRQVDAYFAGLDPFATGGAVSWAGDGPAPVWFDVSREYTERWHHQQQIRDATGRPGLYERRLFEPVLDTFVRGLPHAFRDVKANEGTAVKLRVTGRVEKEWILLCGSRKWDLFECDGTEDRQDAAKAGAAVLRPYEEKAGVVIEAEKAWKIFTRGIRGAEAARCAEISGQRELGEKVVGMVSVIA